MPIARLFSRGALLLALLVASPAVAQPGAQRPAARDSAWWAPLLHHAWLSGGIGWMAAPTSIRRHFEAGQGFAAGLEAHPRRALRLRVGGDYQILPATGEVIFIEESSTPLGVILADTIRYTLRSPGWMGSLRVEASVRAPGGLWLSGGGGRAYFDDGLGDRAGSYGPDVAVRIRGADRDGWAWYGTAGASLGLEPVLHVPIAVGVDWLTARRGDDHLGFWHIRVGTQRK